MKTLILAALLLGVLCTMSACAWMDAHNPYGWACSKIDGKFDPATGNCDKNIFG